MENQMPLMFELMGSSLLGSQDTMDPDTIYSIHGMCRSLVIDFHILNTYRTKATYLFLNRVMILSSDALNNCCLRDTAYMCWR